MRKTLHLNSLMANLYIKIPLKEDGHGCLRIDTQAINVLSNGDGPKYILHGKMYNEAIIKAKRWVVDGKYVTKFAGYLNPNGEWSGEDMFRFGNDEFERPKSMRLQVVETL